MSNLPETMRALVAYSPDKYVLETNWPRPKAGPGEIILKVELWRHLRGRRQGKARGRTFLGRIRYRAVYPGS